MKGLRWVVVVGLATSCGAPAQVAETEGETETEGTGSSGTVGDGMTTVMMTTAPADDTTGGEDNDGTTEDSGPPPTSDEGMTSDDADTGMTGDGTTGGGDMCDACVAKNCADELNACLDDTDCACWLGCIDEGNDQATCFGNCGAPPSELMDVRMCAGTECADECAPDGGSSSSGGGNGDGQYEECAMDGDCNMDAGLECNMFVSYCSIQCEGDDMNCPAPATGDAVPECSDFSDNCILPCNGGTQCPDGMSCNNTGVSQLCTY